ncbi:complement factor D-like [Daphnia carinata]|uniref:complement factor D-like n=1 Tax=Daphnia carinata TaxID=120202 RepID=UPI002868F7A0|nr:complement factor D-like [Daphnia carinata]
MLHAFVLIVCVAAVSANAGTIDEGSERIAGGNRVNNTEQFPFVVSISYRYQHICGGFIYNARWIVTAASCVMGKSPRDLNITIGACSLITPEPEEQSISIADLVPYSGFNPASVTHDIALIELSLPIVFRNTAQPIRFSTVDELAQPLEGTVIGWGAPYEGGPPSARLLCGTMDNLHANCSTYQVNEYIEEYMICAGSESGTVAPCQFDEGSPLVQETNTGGVPELIAIGIMSKNQGCSNAMIPTVYTRLSAYSSWLIQTAGPQVSTNVFVPQF